MLSKDTITRLLANNDFQEFLTELGALMNELDTVSAVDVGGIIPNRNLGEIIRARFMARDIILKALDLLELGAERGTPTPEQVQAAKDKFGMI